MTEVLDELYYRSYKQLETETPVYAWLRRVPDIEGKKSRFFSTSFSENPDLQPEINVTEAQARSWGYLALKDQIGSSDADKVVKDAYIPVIEGKITGIAMLNAAANKDLDAFVESNVKTYDEPDKVIFDTFCQFLRQTAEQYMDEPPSLFVSEAAKQALDLLPDASDNAGKMWSTQAEFRKAKKLFANFFDEMYEGIDLPEKATGEELVSVIEAVLDNLGFDYGVVAQDEGVSTMSVNQVVRKVKVPSKEIYEKKRAKGLIAHEVRIHIEETRNGEGQPLMLLGRGLNGSSKGGEGKGVLVEQVAYDNVQEFMDTQRFFDIIRRQISIGLARGLDGGGQRDFKEVFEIIYALDRMWELARDPDNPNKAVMKALERTWELLTKRTLKGVVGKGAAYFKDKIYGEEPPNQLHLLTKNPDVFPYLNLGHYDLTNPDHVSILKRVGTLPTEMEINLPKNN